MPVTEEEDRAANASTKATELELRLADLVSNQKTVEQQIARLAAQSSLLTDFSNNLISAGEGSSTTALAGEKTVGQ